jgi:hypothetical protein
MKKFSGARELDEIIKLAKEKGFDIDRTQFDKGGDWIWLRDMDGRMVQIKFNVCNGWFYIYTPASGDKPWATHMSSELDDNPLYSEILDLLYV